MKEGHPMLNSNMQKIISCCFPYGFVLRIESVIVQRHLWGSSRSSDISVQTKLITKYEILWLTTEQLGEAKLSEERR